MNKIVSYSLWGDNPKYTIGAIKNAEQVNIYYPGWISRFYCGKSVPNNIILDLKSIPNTEIIEMEDDGDWKSMFWRFYSADSDDICISRDTDSRISYREKKAVDEWLNSDRDFHIMRDHRWHCRPILGGMWGCKNGILKGIKNMINNFDKNNCYQIDQDFLEFIVYPIIKNNCLVHDEFFENKSFPTKRITTEFVGEVYDENDFRHPDYYKFFK
jgi:protein O-GlcNAc transferase